MHFLNELYEGFDELVDEYDMYKLGAWASAVAGHGFFFLVAA